MEALLGATTSSRRRRDLEAGHFTGLNTALIEPTRISFTGITSTGPGEIRGYDNNNREVGLFDIANYRLTTATAGPYHNRAGMRTANFNLRRRLEGWHVPLGLQGEPRIGCKRSMYGWRASHGPTMARMEIRTPSSLRSLFSCRCTGTRFPILATG